MSFDYLASARRTLDVEVQALQKLTGDLDQQFSQACELILNTQGTRHRHRHGQKRPYRQQNCRHLRQHRNTGLLRSSRRS